MLPITSPILFGSQYQETDLSTSPSPEYQSRKTLTEVPVAAEAVRFISLPPARLMADAPEASSPPSEEDFITILSQTEQPWSPLLTGHPRLFFIMSKMLNRRDFRRNQDQVFPCP